MDHTTVIAVRIQYSVNVFLLSLLTSSGERFFRHNHLLNWYIEIHEHLMTLNFIYARRTSPSFILKSLTKRNERVSRRLERRRSFDERTISQKSLQVLKPEESEASKSTQDIEEEVAKNLSKLFTNEPLLVSFSRYLQSYSILAILGLYQRVMHTSH